MTYQTDVLTDIPADSLPAVLQGIQSDPAYVHHHVVAEDDGQFTLFAIFRIDGTDQNGQDDG